jgi:hypothetical protein
MSTEVSEQSAVITPHQHGWFFSTPEEKIKKIKKIKKNIKLQIGSLVQILNVANYKRGSPAHVRLWELEKDLVTEYNELNKEIGKSYNKSDGLHNAASREDIRNDMILQNAELQRGIQAVDARISGARKQEIQEAVARIGNSEANKRKRLEIKKKRREALGLRSNLD